MAVLAVVHCPGATKEMYESLRPSVNWEGNPPAGIVLHACGLDENGDLRVVDVWNSAEEMEDFFRNRLMPVFAQFNTAPPVVNVYPLQNLNYFGESTGQSA